MHIRFLIFLLLSLFSLEAKSQNCFQSSTDVNFYLSTNSVFENSSGNKITFSDMGATCNSGGVTYMNPQIRIINSTTARVTYTSVTISGYSVTITINCSDNTIKDNKDNTIYRKSKTVFDKLEDLKEEIYQERLRRYKEFHENEVFNYIDLNTFLTNDNKKINIPIGGTFYYRNNRREFYSMISDVGGYIINGNLYDDEDNQLGTIFSTSEYYYLDFDTKHKNSPRYRVFMNKKDQINEDVVEKRVFTVGIIDLKTNEKYIHMTNELWVDAASNPLNVIAGAIQLIKWNTNIPTKYEKIPDYIALDSSYIKFINNKISKSVPYKSFIINQSHFKQIDDITWSETTDAINEKFALDGKIEDKFRWRTYAIDSNYLYLQKIMIRDYAYVQDNQNRMYKVWNKITYIGDGQIMIVPINLKDKPRTSKAYLLNYNKTYQLNTNNWWGGCCYDAYLSEDIKPFVEPQNFINQDCENARIKYLEANPDVKNANVDPWYHFNQFGKNEGRKWFDCKNITTTYTPEDCKYSREKYLEYYPDVKTAKIDPWSHYTTYGQKQGRKWFKCISIDFNRVDINNNKIPSDSLIGFWQFNGNTLDSSTNKLDGYNYRNGEKKSTFTLDRFGNVNSALENSNFFPDCKKCNIINLEQSFTISFWVKHEPLKRDPKYPNYVITKDLITFSIQDKVKLNLTIDDKGNINFTRNQRDGKRFIFAAINIQKNIADNNWHFVTMTYNGSEISLSVDENSRSQQSNIILKKKNLIQYPGSVETYHSYKLQLQSGNIDDFIIYKRAITNEEINYLFHYKNSYKE